VSLRTDIQALRGIAVLFVLMHHAKLTPFQAGYLGVNLFFVISGFLITGLIANEIDSGTFSITRFYWRRALRLLPAAYVTFFACAIASPFLLTETELGAFWAQLLGAVTFTANLVLKEQSGYFDTAAELKPLLHVWSLSIEEQYYLLLPGALLLLHRRLWLGFAAVLTAASWIACHFMVATDPTTAFYLLPMRAWELGLGSLLALATRRDATPGISLKWVSLCCFLTLIGIAAHPISAAHPGIDAMLVCLATVGLLAFPSRVLSTGIIGNGLAKVGNISYSLYLVHWPIFAYLNSANLSGAGVWWPLRLAAVLVSFVLAFLLYIHVEQRFRIRGRSGSTPSGVKRVVFVSACLVMIASAGLLVKIGESQNFAVRMRGIEGLAASCVKKGTYQARAECQTSDEPTVMVWGDSHAMHLIPGLVKEAKFSLIQATRAACAPVIGLATFGQLKFAETSSSECIQANQEVLNTIIQRDSLEVVVLSSLWGYLLKGRVAVADEGGADVQRADRDLAVRQLAKTINALRGAGKRVVLVGPPPIGGFDAGRCQQRLAEGKLSFGGANGCRIDRFTAEKRSAEVRAFLAQVSEEADIGVFTFWDLLCDGEFCETSMDGKILYRDTTHFTYEGSELLSGRANLAETLNALAR
jgi:peptidoglycan/LPS O-acetylase OafA/YrhL